MFDIDTFVDNLRNLHLKDKMGLRKWTKGVLDTLVKMGLNLGYEVYPNRELNEGEVLLDCVWYDVNKEPYVHKKMILGAESEWGNETSKTENKDEVLLDFYKLLDFKCVNKVMIYSTWEFGNDYIEEIRKELIDTLRHYENHIEGEKYIFIEFQNDDQAINTYTISIKETGKNSAIEIDNVQKFLNCWE